MKAEDELKELEQNSVSYQGFSNGVEVYTFTHDELARYKKLVAESKLQALKEKINELPQVKADYFKPKSMEGENSFRGIRTVELMIPYEDVLNLITNLEDK